MIRKSFSFLPGIGKKKEIHIINQGITSWTKFLNTENIVGISKKRKLFYNQKIKQAEKALYSFDSSYFNNFKEKWKLYNFFKDEALFLDIEANKDITVIGISDGVESKTFVDNINLGRKNLQKEIDKYKIIITFNGSSYDLPILKKKLNIKINIPHIDLRHLCAGCGLNGGLKEIEKKLGIKRRNIISNMKNGDPSTLFRMYKGSGNPYYLNLLIEYNEEDTINMKRIIEKII